MLMFASATAFSENVSVSIKGTYLTSGAIVYNYLNQNTRATSQQKQEILAGIYITQDTPILRIISEDKTMGLVQIEIKLSDNTLPIIVWARIIDIKK